jgi:hypothetical protein
MTYLGEWALCHYNRHISTMRTSHREQGISSRERIASLNGTGRGQLDESAKFCQIDRQPDPRRREEQMSLFGNKPAPPPLNHPLAGGEGATASVRSYGVADLVRLLKTIPVDQHPDLVVRVVKTTLESVGVHSSQVIEDALKQEGVIHERIAVLEREIDGLAGEIQQRKEEIAQLQVELSEATRVRERLQSAEGVRLAAPPAEPGQKPRSLPPPLPPPLHKPSGKPPEPATGT